MKNKYVILIIVTVLLFCLGSFIANATRTIISVPLGMILMLMPFACLTLFGEICLIKDIKSIIKTKKTKRNKKTKKQYNFEYDMDVNPFNFPNIILLFSIF